MEQVCVNCNKPKDQHRVRLTGDKKTEKHYCHATDRAAGKYDPGQPPTVSIKQPVPAPVKEVSREDSDDATPVRRPRRPRRKP